MREGTGIGVVQRFLLPRLSGKGVEISIDVSRDVGDGLFLRLMGLIRGWRAPAGDIDAYLAVVPPLPFGVRAPIVSVVHDLRWQRTRAGLSRRYREWDLRRTVSHSTVLVCISERTRIDLEKFDRSAIGKTVTAWEGPGIVPPDSFDTPQNGQVLLIGGAPHKRNEFAAEVLATRPDWCSSIVGVGVSDEVRERLDVTYPGATTWLGRVSDAELVTIYRESQYFVFFGIEEGFGLPYIEALSAGCIVVAIDQPLTREILGEAAVLVEDGAVDAVASQLRGPEIPDIATRRGRAERYSWDKFADAILAAIHRAAN